MEHKAVAIMKPAMGFLGPLRQQYAGESVAIAHANAMLAQTLIDDSNNSGGCCGESTPRLDVND